MSSERRMNYQELDQELKHRSCLNYTGWLCTVSTGVAMIGAVYQETIIRKSDDFPLEFAAMSAVSFLAYGALSVMNLRRMRFIKQELKRFSNQSVDNN